MTRAERLMPCGIPRYVRIWDNGGETMDRYTVAYTGRGNGGRWGLAMNAAPTHPQGFCQHWEADKPPMIGLGKRIKFESLPPDCRYIVQAEYREVWGLQ